MYSHDLVRTLNFTQGAKNKTSSGTKAYTFNLDTSGFATTSSDSQTFYCNTNATSNLTTAWQAPAFMSFGNYGSMDSNFCTSHAMPNFPTGAPNITQPSYYVVDLSSGRTVYMQTNF